MADGTGVLVGQSVRVISAFTGHGGANLLYRGRYQLYSLGYARYVTYGFNGVYGGYSLNARGGGKTSVTQQLPALTFSGHGVVTIIGRADLTLTRPKYLFEAHGIVTKIGKAYLLYRGQYELTTRSGGRSNKALTLPALTFTGHGITSSAGSGMSAGTGSEWSVKGGMLPMLTILASGTLGINGKLTAKLPALKVLSSGILRKLLPFPTLSAEGLPSTLIEYEAYSVTMLPDHQDVEQAYVTHYTNYPFEQIVRFGAKYYGVAKDGLFELTGDTFDSQPIVATVETAETDFDIRELKRPISLYLAGRMGADFRVAVTIAEEKSYSYPYYPVIKSGARNYRVLFGKGMRARYLKYSFTNIEGENFEMDEFTPEVAALRRTA